MRKNYSQAGQRAANSRTYLDGDWYAHGIPANVSLAQNVFIDSSYGFAGFRSKKETALFIDEGSGCYDRASFIVAENGSVSVGKYCILNGSTIICNESIVIGDHCMLSWGVVITDSWLPAKISIDERSAILVNIAKNADRNFPFPYSKSVVIEDNVWVGFDAVILPGVTLGQGSVIGCKTIISEDVPPYAVVVGEPARIVKYLEPDDAEDVRAQALIVYKKTGY